VSPTLAATTLHNGAVHAATTFLAQPEGADPGGKGEDFGKSTPLGLLLLVLSLIAIALLVRSMSKHLKRVPTSFGDDTDAPETSDDQSAQAAAAAESGVATAERADTHSDRSGRSSP